MITYGMPLTKSWRSFALHPDFGNIQFSITPDGEQQTGRLAVVFNDIEPQVVIDALFVLNRDQAIVSMVAHPVKTRAPLSRHTKTADRRRRSRAATLLRDMAWSCIGWPVQ